MSAAEDGGDDDAAPSGGVDRGRYADAAATGEDDAEGGAGGSLSTERVRPRKQLPPLLVNVADVRRPERVRGLLRGGERQEGLRRRALDCPPASFSSSCVRRSTGWACRTA